MSIELYIERLVIDEVALGGEQPAAVRMAMTRELQRLLAHPNAVGMLAGVGVVASLPSGRLPPPATAADRLGPRLARAVHQVLDTASPTGSPRGASR